MSIDFIKISKNDAVNFAISYAVLFIFIMIILEFLVIKTCKEGLGCLLFGSIPLLPGMIFMKTLGADLNTKLFGMNLYVHISIFIWGIIGAVVGFIISSFKNKENVL